ncbi:4'-phosphopantetheinyl transferase superfamily protein [Flavobacterium sp.]|uniref:4'-phosphopantetheinyl transferase family protein n=1 Tax=Flavobacterium sp. TaxID=239 RepID=UPI0025E674DD|nr:4'-phosphopantetheinyl transferase superfamily protein [Flavobacterium sp.]
MSTVEINTKLSLLPVNLKTAISSYKLNEKKQQRITGLELLKTALINNKMDADLINTIQYNPFGKPFVNVDIDFSISYSDNNTILGFIKNGSVGIDIEHIKRIDYKLYKDYFTKNEWEFMNENSFTEAIFFKLWTRKEAAVKAIGKGAFFDLKNVEVINEFITIENKNLKLSTEFFENQYCFSSASTSL